MAPERFENMSFISKYRVGRKYWIISSRADRNMSNKVSIKKFLFGKALKARKPRKKYSIK